VGLRRCRLDSSGSGYRREGEFLWTRQWTFGTHKTWGNSWLAERLSAFQ